MDSISDLDEIIDKVFIEIKELFSFLELDDLDIYKLIKKSIGKNKIIVRDELLKKVSRYYSKKLVKEIVDDRYDDIDRFFEVDFICCKKTDEQFESLNRLVSLLGNINNKSKYEVYTKLFKRYDALTNLLSELCEACNYHLNKVTDVIYDRKIQEVVQFYFEFIGVSNKDNNVQRLKYEESHEEFENLEEVSSVYYQKEGELIKRYYKYRDEESMEELIRINIPLVKHIAKNYKEQGLMYDDLVAVGLGGLYKAIVSFNPNKKSRLSTYAYTIIKRHIINAINSESRIIRIPDWRSEELKKYNYEKRNFISRYGVIPKNEDMAKLLNISLEKVEENEYLLSDYVSSLSFKVDNENDIELGEILEDKNLISPEDYAIQACMRRDINEILNEALTEQEKIVIDLAFGAYDGVVRNNAEIGRDMYEFGLYHVPLSRERIRQILNKALFKLNSPEYVKKLELYL